MIQLINLCIIVLFSSVQSEIFSSRRSFRETNKKPGDVSQIALIEKIQVLESCLIKCDQAEKCASMVYEETTGRCVLYSTTVGVQPLVDGQKAITHCKIYFSAGAGGALDHESRDFPFTLSR